MARPLDRLRAFRLSRALAPALPRPPRSEAWRIARRAALVLASTMLALGLAMLALQTGPGRSAIADLLSERLSDARFTIVLRGLEGPLLARPRFASVTVSDAGGVLASGENVAVEIRPAALLRGRIDPVGLSAARVTVSRLPDWLETAGLALHAPAALDGSDRLRRLHVEELVIPGVSGPVRLLLEGAIDRAPGTPAFEARFLARRTDGTAGIADFRMRHDPVSRVVDLRLRTQEAAGGAAAALLGLPNAPTVEVAADLEGTLDQLSWALVLSGGDRGRAELVGRLDRAGARRNFRLTGAADVGRLVAERDARLFEGVLDLTASGRIEPDGRIAIERGALNGAAGRAALVGSFGGPNGGLDLDFDLIAGDAARYRPRLPVEAGWSALRLFGRLSGTRQQPVLGLSLEADGLAIAGNRAGRIEGSAMLEPERTAGTVSDRLRLMVKAEARELASSDPRYAPMLHGSGRLQLAAILGEGRPVLFDQLALDLEAGRLRYSGEAGPALLAGSLTAQDVDLAALSGLYGAPLRGRADLTTRIDAAAAPRRLGLNLKLDIEDLSTGDAGLDRVVGGPLSVEGGLRAAASGEFAFDRLALRAKGLSLTADGDAQTPGTGAEVQIVVPDLRAVDPGLAGELRAGARFGGPPSALRMSMRTEVASGSLYGRRVESLALEASVDDLFGRSRGALALSGTLGGKPLTASALLTRPPDSPIELAPVDAGFGPLRGRGRLTLAGLDRLRGALDFECPSLQEVGRALALPLDGAASGKLEFVDGRGPTAVRLTGKATELAFGPGRARLAEFEGELPDLFHRTLARGRADVYGAAIAGLASERLRVTLEARPTATILGMEGAVSGVEVSARGRIVPLPEETRIGIETLLATARGEKVALANPTFLRLGPAGLEVDQAVLHARDGELTVDGRIGQTLELTVEGKAMPLALAEVVAPSLELAGLVGGSVSVTGTADRPRGRYRLDLDGIGTDVTGSERLSGRIEGELLGERASLAGSLAGPRTSLALAGSVPIAGTPLDLSVKGKVDLGTLGGFLPKLRLAGTSTVDLRFAGTAAAPQVTGRAEGTGLAVASGPLSLSDAALALQGEGRQLQLQRLEGKLSAGGRLSAYGRVTLDPAAGFPADLKLDLEGARSVEPLTTATLDGTLSLEGPLAGGPTLRGLLALRNVELRLPESAGGETPPRREEGLGDRVKLEVKVAAPNRVSLRGRGVEAEFGGEIAVRGTLREPIGLGSLEFRRGLVTLADWKLPLTAGSVSFLKDLDPTVTLAARAAEPDGWAELALEGRLSAPTLELRAEPPAEGAAVMARLLAAAGAGPRAAEPALIERVIPELSGRRPRDPPTGTTAPGRRG